MKKFSIYQLTCFQTINIKWITYINQKLYIQAFKIHFVTNTTHFSAIKLVFKYVGGIWATTTVVLIL